LYDDPNNKFNIKTFEDENVDKEDNETDADEIKNDI